MDTRDREVKLESEKMSLLLIGGPGHGKSTIANALVTEEIFKVDDPLKSIDVKTKRNNKYEVTEYRGLVENIGDVDEIFKAAKCAVLKNEPGKQKEDNELFNKSTLNENSAEGASNKSEHDKEDEGFDALIFVIKYGIRFTKQENDAVEMIKFVFGKDIFKDRGIIAFTFGEDFQSKDQFDEYIRQQEGNLITLLHDANNRYVFTKSGTDLNDTFLDTYLAELKEKNDNKKYTMKKFRAAALESYKKRLEDKYNRLENDADLFLFHARSELQYISGPVSKEQCKKMTSVVEQIKSFVNDEDMGDDFKKLLEKIKRSFDITKQQFCESKSKHDGLFKVLDDIGAACTANEEKSKLVDECVKKGKQLFSFIGNPFHFKIKKS